MIHAKMAFVYIASCSYSLVVHSTGSSVSVIVEAASYLQPQQGKETFTYKLKIEMKQVQTQVYLHI